MSNRILIERLEIQGRCGLTPEERQSPQPLAIDIELIPAAQPAQPESDEGILPVDYTTVVDRLHALATARPYRLLETLAEEICQTMLRDFPLTALRLWLRKTKPAVPGVRGSVGVRLERTRAEALGEFQPAPFLEAVVDRLPHGSGRTRQMRGDALDVAAGRGRHTLYLARQGFAVEAIDRDAEALRELEELARAHNLTQVQTRPLDLEDPAAPPSLPKERYDVILVFFYLYRPLFPALLNALKPGGMLVYETFLIDNHLRYQHPRRREFCLEHNELLRLSGGLRVLHYEEGEHPGGCGHTHDRPTAFTARLLACKD